MKSMAGSTQSTWRKLLRIIHLSPWSTSATLTWTLGRTKLEIREQKPLLMEFWNPIGMGALSLVRFTWVTASWLQNAYQNLQNWIIQNGFSSRTWTWAITTWDQKRLTSSLQFCQASLLWTWTAQSWTTKVCKILPAASKSKRWSFKNCSCRPILSALRVSMPYSCAWKQTIRLKHWTFPKTTLQRIWSNSEWYRNSWVATRFWSTSILPAAISESRPEPWSEEAFEETEAYRPWSLKRTPSRNLWVKLPRLSMETKLRYASRNLIFQNVKSPANTSLPILSKWWETNTQHSNNWTWGTTWLGTSQVNL